MNSSLQCPNFAQNRGKFQFIVKTLCILLLVLFYSQICFAETSVAVKAGYVSYKESGDSEYEGNNMYDSEISYGAFISKRSNDWVTRIDIDYNKTGNTFQNHIPYPYEQINLEQTNVMLSSGRYFNNLYILLGTGYTFNSGTIEQYQANPFNYEIKDNYFTAITGGLEIPMDKWFMFIEGRYMWSEFVVEFDNSEITEDTDNLQGFVGIGRKF